MEKETLKNRTARGLMWGGIGTGSMQLLNLLFGIFLSRLLSPADYGMVGALTIFSATAGLLAESGFTMAIAHKREATHEDYNSVFWFNLVVGVFLYLLLYLLAPAIARFYDKPGMDAEMTSLARFLFLSFMIGAMAATPSAYFFRNLDVKIRSKIQITAIIVSGTAGIICAICGCRYWGIAVQTVLYSVTNALLLWIHVPWHPTFTFSWAPIAAMLPYSSKQLFTSLFTHFNNNLFSMLLGRFYTMRVTGFYTQGSKWTMMGYSTITGMLNSVALPVLREASHDGDNLDLERVRRVFLKMLRFTAFISFPAMLGLAIIASEVIEISVGAKWLDCVPVMHILCIWGAFAPIATLYANLFNSLGRPAIYMWNTIAQGVTQIVAVLVTYSYGLEIMLWVYTAINIAWLLIWQYFGHKHIKLSYLTAIWAMLPYIGAAVIAMGVAVVAASTFDNIIVTLTIKILVAATIYCLITWLCGSQVFREAITFLRKKHHA